MSSESISPREAVAGEATLVDVRGAPSRIATNVAHVDGGFPALRDQGLPIQGV